MRRRRNMMAPAQARCAGASKSTHQQGRSPRLSTRGLWRRRDGPRGLHRAWSEHLQGAPPLALRLSVRRVCLDGGGLTLSSREPPMCRPTLSPLDTVEITFRLLATGPQPLALHGHTIGLRRDSIGLWDLRGLLFHPATDVDLQRAALVELVGRARRHRGAWMIALVGVLLPGLHQQEACPAPSVRSRPRRAPMSRYLTVEEVAEALGVSASWVYKHTDLLGGVRLGKRLWRFPEQELTTLLAQPARGSPRSATEDADGGRPRQPSARP